jgi:hypothetical protein
LREAAVGGEVGAEVGAGVGAGEVIWFLLGFSLVGVDEGLLGTHDCDEVLLLMEVVTVEVGSAEASLCVVVERADAENVPDEILFSFKKVDGFQQELDAAPLGCSLTREMKVVEVGEHLGVLGF